MKNPELKVYGIPNCGTCKKAIAWLQEKDIPYEFISTREHPPTKERIADWVSALTARPMRNTSGGSYRALPEEKKEWSDPQWIEAFAQDAMLLKRPLFEKDGKAVMVGFRAKEDEKMETLGG
ncbi:MAG: Spx/MgsR family RNA polymerase-binding regulatory protein [Phormidesmis sp.]